MLSSFTASLNPSVLESPINTSLSAEIVSGWSGLLKVPWSAGFCLSVSASCSGVGVDAGIGVASGFCVSADLDFGVDLDFDVDVDFDFAIDFGFSVGVTVRVFGAGGPAASVPWTFENIQTATIHAVNTICPVLYFFVNIIPFYSNTYIPGSISGHERISPEIISS